MVNSIVVNSLVDAAMMDKVGLFIIRKTDHGHCHPISADCLAIPAWLTLWAKPRDPACQHCPDFRFHNHRPAASAPQA
jgi:hypothetical protein